MCWILPAPRMCPTFPSSINGAYFMQPWPWNWLALNCPWYLRNQRTTKTTQRVSQKKVNRWMMRRKDHRRRHLRLYVMLHLPSNGRQLLWRVTHYVVYMDIEIVGHRKKRTVQQAAYFDVYIRTPCLVYTVLLRHVISRKCYSRVAIYVLENSLSFSQAVHKLALYSTSNGVLSTAGAVGLVCTAAKS